MPLFATNPFDQDVGKCVCRPPRRPPGCGPARPALCGRSGPPGQATLSPFREAPSSRVRRRLRAWRILLERRWDPASPRNGPWAGTAGLERAARRVAVGRARGERLARPRGLGPSCWARGAGRAAEGAPRSGGTVRPRPQGGRGQRPRPGGGPGFQGAGWGGSPLCFQGEDLDSENARAFRILSAPPPFVFF